MDGAIIGVIAAVGFNILVSAFGAGKLYQKVGDLTTHIDGLEKKLDTSNNHLSKLAERVANVEGRLDIKDG